jgi:hypothetical protein
MSTEPQPSLAQSLVDAAQDALDRTGYPEWLAGRGSAQSAVAAVLDGLAEAERTYGVVSLADLAAEVRESPCP